MNTEQARNRIVTNLDELRRLREEALAAGFGSGRWILGAQALMDAFPDYYHTANQKTQAP